jgi:hypothetical protein
VRVCFLKHFLHPGFVDYSCLLVSLESQEALEDCYYSLSRSDWTRSPVLPIISKALFWRNEFYSIL